MLYELLDVEIKRKREEEENKRRRNFNINISFKKIQLRTFPFNTLLILLWRYKKEYAKLIIRVMSLLIIQRYEKSTINMLFE